MSPIPGFGLAKLLILVGCAGLALLIGAVIVAVIVTRRKRSSAQLNDSSANGNDRSKRTTPTKKESRSQGKRIAVLVLLVLLALCALPLLAVVGGILLVTPLSSTRTVDHGPEPMIRVVEIQATPAATLLPTPTAAGAVTANPPQSVSTSTDNTRSDLGLNPFSKLTMLVILPGIAGLVLLIGAAAAALIVKNWGESDPQLKNTGTNGDNGGKRARTAKLRYGLLAFIFWIALSFFFMLDLNFSVSLYFRFVAIYIAFWFLVGALLLRGSPTRHKLLILGLFVVIVFSVRFVNWTTLKPFLKDFYSIKEGMTPAQVEQIMGSYIIGDGKTEINEQGEIVAGSITYRHTNEGWGDSDWGVATFEDGRVVEIEFLPD